MTNLPCNTVRYFGAILAFVLTSLQAIASPVISVTAESMTTAHWHLIDSSDPQNVSFKLRLLADSKSSHSWETQGNYHLDACNSINGPYKIKGDKLYFDLEKGSTTLIGCPPDSGERLAKKFIRHAAEGLAFKVMGSRLTLHKLNNPEVFYIFEAQYVPSDKAQTKFIEIAPKRVQCKNTPVKLCLNIRYLTYDSQSVEIHKSPWQEVPNNIINYEHQDGLHRKVRILVDNPEPPLQGYANPVWYADIIIYEGE
jgi:heat shock protein HslJ